MKKILIIDDDNDMCILLSKFLKSNGFETEIAYSGNKGIQKFKESGANVVMCDFRLGDCEGRKVLHEIKTIDPHAIVIIITGYSNIKTAIEMIKAGAYDYIVKPLIPAEVIGVINRGLNQSSSATFSIKDPANKINDTCKGEDFLTGIDPATQNIYGQIDLVAPTNYSVILYGESGTGKEVMARTIHNKSKRKDKPFIAMDCGTLSKELAGSELFGHVKGSFTGAISEKEGHFELANGGTLFLDEVANLSYDIQAALLRVIQEKKCKKVGGVKEIDIDVRIIVASNENLKDAYERGKFREDLFHRFNEFAIKLPPLRHRKKDIPLFAAFFLEKANKELRKTNVITGFDDDVMEKFLEYSWPGNVRELHNVIRRATLLTQEGLIKSKVLPAEIIESANPGSKTSIAENDGMEESHQNLKDVAAEAEYQTILSVLKEVNFKKSKAAEILNINRKTLYNKLREHELGNS
jgi:two-component system, NtrC family, response regulator HydG